MDYSRLSCYSLYELLTMSKEILELTMNSRPLSSSSSSSSSSLTSSPKSESCLSPQQSTTTRTSPVTITLEDVTSETNEVNLSSSDVDIEESKPIDHQEKKIEPIGSLSKEIDDSKCLPERETTICDNLYQFDSNSDSVDISCVPKTDSPLIEMLPTYKKIIISGAIIYQCRYIDCYFVSDQLNIVRDHHNRDHGVFKCGICSTLYFTLTERDNCVSLHESERIAQVEISRRVKNDHHNVVKMVKPIFIRRSRLSSMSRARAQAQLVAGRHLSVITARNEYYAILTEQQLRECKTCCKSFRTESAARAHYRYSHKDKLKTI